MFGVACVSYVANYCTVLHSTTSDLRLKIREKCCRVTHKGNNMLNNYRLVVGCPLSWALDDDHNPHLEILLKVQQRYYRASINIRSKIAPHTLMYGAFQDFILPKRGSLSRLKNGVYNLRAPKYRHLAIDYIRSVDRNTPMVSYQDLQQLPYEKEGPDNDLREKLIPLIRNAVSHKNARCFVFGETWGPEKRPDIYFNTKPSYGIHNIHMNQGNHHSMRKDDGIWQDGALIIQMGGTWIAVFLAFSTQIWRTNRQGHSLSTNR